MNAEDTKVPMPVITVFGNKQDGLPVIIKVHGFLPYLYAQIVHQSPTQSGMNNRFEKEYSKDLDGGRYNNQKSIGREFDPNSIELAIRQAIKRGQCMGVEKVYKKSIYGYAKEDSLFYKIFFNNPFSLKEAKTILEDGSIIVNNTKLRFKTYESGFPFILRFMNDLGITGMSYIKIKNYKVLRNSKIHKSEHPDKFSPNTDMIIETYSHLITAIPPVGEYMKLPPLKMLSFDIECVGSTTAFPVPGKDPVIQIGNTIQRFGETETRRDIFCLKETAEIPGSNVYSFNDEAELLKAWIDYWHKEDPDIIIGYNIKGFDFPYLLERAEVLGITDFAVLGRTENKSKVVSRQQSSSAFGAFDSKDITIDGRLIFDLLHIIKRDHKLRSYSLNAVSFHFLGEQKEDVSYLAMHELQNGTKETRRRIASYCLQDTYLPLRLFDKLNILINFSELARATHVPVEYFSTRGSAIKVLSQIYFEASRAGFLIPDMDVGSAEDGYEGAFVMDPARGFYSEPIAVLDFSSLYPSIIISKNMCYSTLLLSDVPVDHIESPTHNKFCTASVREGLLPRILRSLLAARKEAKSLLKDAKDPFIRRSLDGRQLALKICANSIYGFTGSPTGQLMCLPISQSTTAFGREMIAKTKDHIESNFNRSTGHSYDTKVIYGDTDSVMIRFNFPIDNKENDNPGILFDNKEHNLEFSKDNTNCIKDPNNRIPLQPNMNDSARMSYIFDEAKRIAASVSNTFEKPVSLEFEKVYYPYLLMNKKRYAGLLYTKPDKYDKIDTKGIETVRRDNCELVKDLIQTCINKILIDKDVPGAINHVKETVRDLYTDNIDLSQLVISKTYTKTEYATKQTHAELVEKLKRRGVQVNIGDRIPYVIVKGDKKSLACEKSEDPVYVLENSLPIDKEYYIEQQLSKPVHRLFEAIIDNISSLFRGEHTKVIAQSVAVRGPMNMFVKAIEECVGCRRPGRIICVDCAPRFMNHYTALQTRFDEKTALYNACWVECQRCQGSVVNEVLCINRICPIWYKRTKIKKELSPMQEKLAKLRQFSW